MRDIDTVVISESREKILHHQKEPPRLKHGEKCTGLREAECNDDIEVLKCHSQ